MLISIMCNTVARVFKPQLSCWSFIRALDIKLFWLKSSKELTYIGILHGVRVADAQTLAY